MGQSWREIGAGISHIVLASPKVDDGCRDGSFHVKTAKLAVRFSKRAPWISPRFSYVKSFAPARNTCPYPTPLHVDEDVQPSHARRAPRVIRSRSTTRWEIDDFSEAEVERLFEATLAYGRELGVDTVTFTRDARLGCAAVLEIGVQVAPRSGFRVVACTDPISTPQGYFVTLRTSARHPKTMGLVVTASHNPAQYIGVKFTVPTVQAHRPQLRTAGRAIESS